MTTPKKPPHTGMPPFYEVGYGKPPKHTRFQKGQSGNPGGRKRGITTERAKALALKEAYRKLRVQEDEGVVAMPAIQAIMRSQVSLAAKGNGPAQRAVIKAVEAIEKELAAIEAAESARRKKPIDIIDAARRVSFLLRLADIEEKKRAEAAAPGDAAAAGKGVCGGASDKEPSKS
jgi:hypothetical protein